MNSMNYTPEQQRDIARLQELGALVTDADTVKYDKEVAPKKGIWKYLAQGLDRISELLTFAEGVTVCIALANTLAIVSHHRLAIEFKDFYWGALILCFVSSFLRLLSKLPAVHIKKTAAYYYIYTCIITAEQMLAIKKEFDARGLTNNLNTQTFSAKNAFREETLAEDRDTTGAFFALAIASIAYLSHVFDFTSAAIVMMALIALDILLCHMNKKAGNA